MQQCIYLQRYTENDPGFYIRFDIKVRINQQNDVIECFKLSLTTLQTTTISSSIQKKYNIFVHVGS